MTALTGLQPLTFIDAWLNCFSLVTKRYTLEELMRLSAKVNANTLKILRPVAIAIAIAIFKSEGVQDADLDSIGFIMCSGATRQAMNIDFLRSGFLMALSRGRYDRSDRIDAEATPGIQRWQYG